MEWFNLIETVYAFLLICFLIGFDNLYKTFFLSFFYNMLLLYFQIAVHLFLLRNLRKMVPGVHCYIFKK